MITPYAEWALVVPLAAAAWQDVLRREVADWTWVSLAAVGLLLRLTAGPRGLVFSVGAAAVVFACLLVVYARHGIGGGDVKLIAAMALGLAPFATLRFVVATAIAGGALGLLYLAIRQSRSTEPAPAGSSLAARLWAIERWRARRRGIPYAVAIALGAVWTLAPIARP